MVDRAYRCPVAGIWLLALLATAVVGFRGCSYDPDIDLAVTRGSGDSPLRVYVKQCGQFGAHVISFSELIGGSRTSWGVPIYWQIASRAGSRRAVYQVGRPQPGFATTVPLVADFPRGHGDFYEIDVDGIGRMGFTFDDVQSGRVLTNDYGTMSERDYVASLGAECQPGDDGRDRWLLRLLGSLIVGFLFFVGLSITLALLHRLLPRTLGPLRPLLTQTAAAATAAFVGVAVLLTILNEPHQAGPPQGLFPRGRPSPGRLEPSVRPPQRVLATFESTDPATEALTTTQFTANGRYVMYVGCSGTSIQVSEGFDTTGAAYGARTVAFCNPATAVPSALSTSPKGVVTLGVMPNSTRRWRVTVATG